MAARVTRGEVAVGERPDGSRIALPVVRFEGEQGPSVFIGASIHGDELTGQASLWRLAEFLRDRPLRGRLTLIPVMNPEGFNFNVRGIPQATVDLNRLYPGDPSGSLPERITAAIWGVACTHEIVVDVHTAGWCIPFVLLDPVGGRLGARVEEMAHATGVTVLGEYPAEKYEMRHLGASLPGVALREGRAAFTLELGGFRGVDWASVEAGYVALRNLLAHLGLVEAKREPITSCPTIAERGYRRRDVHATKGGLMEYAGRPGAPVRRGEPIARVRNVFGDVVEEVLAPEDGFLIALNATGVARTGGYVAEMAVRPPVGARSP